MTKQQPCLQSENEQLRAGYDAARLEIASLRERVQMLGQLARDVNSRRVVELEAETARLTTCLRKANAEFEHFEREWYLRGDEIEALQAQLEAVGAGGVEPLRKRECLHKISEPAQPVAQAQDAARYQFLRDGEWRDTELEPFIRLQLNTMWDAKIDAAIAAQQGTAP